MALDPLLNIWFNSEPGTAYATASGSKGGAAGHVATVTAYAAASGTLQIGKVYDATAIAYAIASGDLLLEGLKKNFVKWSKIGNLDFTVGRDNVANERPMDWKGWTYAIKKLGNKPVVYGENGVTILAPSGVHYGMNTIYRIGLKSKQAVAGNEDIHFFIDNKDQLFSLGEELKKLDYSEYLSVLTAPVLLYDLETDLLYICDGTYGFVYSPKDKSLGEGPINITGISSQGGTLYVAAPATVATPVFEICTDIYDLGSRNTKTITSIEIGIDLSETLYASIYYRMNTDDSFTQTSWSEVSGNGRAWITTFGREFKFGVKILNYEYLEIDWIKVNGVAHAN